MSGGDVRWQKLDDWPYEVSEYGQVRHAQTKRVRRLKCLHKYGYLTVAVVCPQKKKNVNLYVHRMVCMAFHGAPPRLGMEVDHRDKNTQNNTPSNLRWVEKSENLANRVFANGEDHCNAKLTVEAVREIRASNESSRAIAPKFGIGDRHVRDIRMRRCWAHVD